MRRGLDCRWLGAVACLLIYSALTLHGSALAPLPREELPAGVEVDFSGGPTDLVGRIAELVGTAKKEILVSEYAITDVRVLEGLRRAAARGVMVAVLLDRSPAFKNYETPRFLRQLGIPVVTARRGPDGKGWHNQHYLVLDREALLLTSFDLTPAAQHNAENLLVLRLPSIVARYYNTWLDEAAAGERLP